MSAKHLIDYPRRPIAAPKVDIEERVKQLTEDFINQMLPPEGVDEPHALEEKPITARGHDGSERPLTFHELRDKFKKQPGAPPPGWGL